MIHEEILSSIDNIDDCVMEAELSVLTAMINEYDKAIMIMENYNGNDYECFDIFQESVIMEDGETKEPKKKESFFKKIWNGIKAILSRFISFLKRKCKYIGLLVKMKKNPDEKVFCPLPLKGTYDAYVRFENAIDKVSGWLKTFDPREIDSVGKYSDWYFSLNSNSVHSIEFESRVSRMFGLKDLTEVYEKIDKGIDINDNGLLSKYIGDAGDKKKTKERMVSQMFSDKIFGHDHRDETIIPIKTIIENIQNLNNVRKSISEKIDLMLKTLEKYENISSDNEWVNDVLKYISEYRKPILDFMKLDMTLERCLNTQFEIFTKYSKKHSRSSKDKSQNQFAEKWVKDASLKNNNNSTITTTLIMDIINGELKGDQVHMIVSCLENKYGNDFFANYDVEKRPQTEWNEEYLKELEIKSMTGMTSKQFIYHLSEVSDFVHEHSKKKKKR